MPERIKPDYKNLEVNEPYLGPWWAVLMLALYGLKRAFPPVPYTLWWFVFCYLVTLFITVTVFTVYKRYKFNRWVKGRKGDG